MPGRIASCIEIIGIFGRTANAVWIEWVIVGMVGQVPVLKGQPVNPAWRRMKDISSAVELWFIR